MKKLLTNLIVIEGLDGVGKSTQIKLLKDYFSFHGVACMAIHFPVLNGIYGELISEYLRGELGTLDQVPAKLVGLLFANNRKEYLSKIEEWLKEGKVVIIDRYINSNVAFQCAKVQSVSEKSSLKDWIIDYEYNYLGLPSACISFFLDLPLDIIRDSLSSERSGEDRDYLNGKSDIHEDSMLLQREVRNEYIKMLKDQPSFKLIHCATPQGERFTPNEIHLEIVKRIMEVKDIELFKDNVND